MSKYFNFVLLLILFSDFCYSVNCNIKSCFCVHSFSFLYSEIGLELDLIGKANILCLLSNLVLGQMCLIPQWVPGTEVLSLYLSLSVTVDQVTVCKQHHTFSLIPNVSVNFAYDYRKLQFCPLAIG